MLTAALLALALAAPPALPAPPAPAPADSHRLGDWPRAASGKTVTITRHHTVDEALEKIAEAAGWNLVANTGRLGDRTLVVTLRGAPVEEALDAVLEGSPLVATRRGNTVTVAPGRAPAAAEVPVLSGFDRPSGKRFSGDLADEPVDRALRKVTEAGGFSLVFPPGLRGAVSGHFKDAPVEEVLRAILAQAGLVAARDGAVVTVARGAGGSSLVIDGRRRISIPTPGLAADIGREIDQAVREAKRAADEAKRGAAASRRRPDAADAGAADAEEGADAAAEVPGDDEVGGSRPGRHRRGDKVVRGDVTIGPGERARDVVVFTGVARLEAGAAAKQVTAILGSVEVGPGATVEHEVVAIGGDVHLAPGARIGGDAVSIGGKIVIDEGAEVEGQQTAIDVPGLGKILSMAGSRSGSEHRAEPSAAWRVARALTQFVVFFGLGLLLFLVFPRRVEAVLGSLQHAPFRATATGVVGVFAFPVVFLLLCVTIVGIPFAFTLLPVAYAAAAAMGFTALALWLGRALPFRFDKGAPVIQLAMGTALLVTVAQVPILGKLLLLTIGLLVLGAVVRTRFGQPPQAPPPLQTTAPPPAVPAA